MHNNNVPPPSIYIYYKLLPKVPFEKPLGGFSLAKLYN